MKKHVFITCAALLLIVSGCGKSHKEKEEATAVPSVSVLTATEDSILIHKSYPGMLVAAKNVDVVARVNGTLLRKLYAAGTYVKQGQPLFTIESTTYQNAATEASAALATAKSEYEYARRQYDAMQKALREDAVAEMEVLKAKSAMQEAQASIRQATAALSDARINIGYCTVRAPFSGIISDATLNEGAYVGGGVSPVALASIYDTSIVCLGVNIEDATAIEMFSNGNLNMNSLPIVFSEKLGHDYVGSLSYKDPAVDPSTGTLYIKADIKNTYNELKPGMYANLQVPLKVEPHAVLVNDASIGTDQRGSYIYVVNDSNKVVYTPVTIGELYADTLRVIEKGIKPGTRYVSKAMLKVRPGMKVKPVTTKK